MPANVAAFPIPRAKAPASRGMSPAGMPMPGSLIAISAAPFWRASLTATWPPRGEYFRIPYDVHEQLIDTRLVAVPQSA